MHLTPREQERMTIFTVAEFARRRLRSGTRLSAPEAIAVICDEVMELAWLGVALDELVERAHRIIGTDDVIDGVASLVRHVQVEAMFPSGSALVAIDDPLGAPPAHGPGGVVAGSAPIDWINGRDRKYLVVRNAGPVPVFVSSHFPFADVNASLVFDRTMAANMRLFIAAGSALRWAPGEERRVELIAYPANRPEQSPSPVRVAQ